MKLEISVNEEVIDRVEKKEDGWITLHFKPPHPIKDGKSHNIGKITRKDRRRIRKEGKKQGFKMKYKKLERSRYNDLI
ncbi:MAG: hypothetical protein ACFFG0_12295 [Candidatus Thorarchaeota archaeon]